LEVKLSNKFKNGHENFLAVKDFNGFGTSCLYIIKLGSSKTIEILTCKKISIIIYDFIGQLYLQNDIFELREVTELEIRAFLAKTNLKVSKHFLFYRFEKNQRCKKDSKNSFENETQKRRNQLYFGFRKIPCCLFPQPLNKGIFSVFGRYSKNKFGLKIKQESLNFFLR
jgi:hypothetical protein